MFEQKRSHAAKEAIHEEEVQVLKCEIQSCKSTVREADQVRGSALCLGQLLSSKSACAPLPQMSCLLVHPCHKTAIPTFGLFACRLATRCKISLTGAA
jgi:hypothetical protein